MSAVMMRRSVDMPLVYGQLMEDAEQDRLEVTYLR